jgi:DNA-binding NtrC family response regulator
MTRLSTLLITAHVFDNGMLGVKMPAALRPGTYEGALALQRQEVRALEPAASPESFVPLPLYLEQAKADCVRKALDACGGNRTQTAKLLGVDVRTIFRMLFDE